VTAPCRHWVLAPARFCGLTGPDGWPSWSKIVSAGVVYSYLRVRQPVPAGVAGIVIIAAFGRAMMRDWIVNKGVTVAANVTEAITAAADSVADKIWKGRPQQPAPGKIP
jgi:xanthosine utilization system XapX-like protein